MPDPESDDRQNDRPVPGVLFTDEHKTPCSAKTADNIDSLFSLSRPCSVRR